MVKNPGIQMDSAIHCYHCGEECKNEVVSFDQQNFCCDGCKLVYDLLKENSLCTYYNLNERPGISPGKSEYAGKYDYLDNPVVADKLIRYRDENQVHIVFFIPKIHCSSCIWLLENLHKINPGIFSSSVNFLRKEVTIFFDFSAVKLSEIATILSRIGYEPLIHLGDLEQKKERGFRTSQIAKIGLAGFCFGNIMMLSFPEYFSLGTFHDESNLKYFFGYLNLFLSIPVFFYCASSFFSSAYQGIRHRFLNIDAPIALAILVTFSRSVFEIVSHTGAGYMDSMTGIVFFMLLGRFFQEKTYDTLSFERDYKSFFPVGVTVKKTDGKEINLPVSELKKGDVILIRNQEIIPSDAILLSQSAHIDYSFITGESLPLKRERGQLIYAGGKQLAGAIELEIVNPTSQSYLTQLWNKDTSNHDSYKAHQTYIEKINTYFTIIVLVVSISSALFWLWNDSSKALNALTAVLIVACPCGLLLTSTFAHGNVLRIFGRNKFYLKNAWVIDKLCKTDTILFDKTGTITQGSSADFTGKKLVAYELELLCSLASQSSHPLSRKIYSQYKSGSLFDVQEFVEMSGQGIKGLVDGKFIVLGSEYFVTGNETQKNAISGNVFFMIGGQVLGFFGFKTAFRKGLDALIYALLSDYKLELLSGDNGSDFSALQPLFGDQTSMFFNQKPEDKMQHVQNLQQQGLTVMMVGDGLNDSGALKQSDVGIAVSDDTNSFSPASDAIIDGSVLDKLPKFIGLAKTTKKIIVATFAISLTYNVIGLVFAMQGILSPVVAAILMPMSSVTIVLLSTLTTGAIARWRGL